LLLVLCAALVVWVVAAQPSPNVSVTHTSGMEPYNATRLAELRAEDEQRRANTR
jgi:hypothetical protein